MLGLRITDKSARRRKPKSKEDIRIFEEMYDEEVGDTVGDTPHSLTNNVSRIQLHQMEAAKTLQSCELLRIGRCHQGRCQRGECLSEN